MIGGRPTPHTLQAGRRVPVTRGHDRHELEFPNVLPRNLPADLPLDFGSTGRRTAPSLRRPTKLPALTCHSNPKQSTPRRRPWNVAVGAPFSSPRRLIPCGRRAPWPRGSGFSCAVTFFQSPNGTAPGLVGLGRGVCASGNRSRLERWRFRNSGLTPRYQPASDSLRQCPDRLPCLVALHGPYHGASDGEKVGEACRDFGDL